MAFPINHTHTCFRNKLEESRCCCLKDKDIGPREAAGCPWGRPSSSCESTCNAGGQRGCCPPGPERKQQDQQDEEGGRPAGTRQR